MNRSFIFCGLFILLTFSACFEPARPEENSLGKIADHALAVGTNATLNVGFARYLGLTADEPVPLKRVRFEEDGATNSLSVLVKDPNTIILVQRRQLLGWFYLTDRSGTLKRAVVNDGAVADGGITNLSLALAAKDFEELKRSWLQRSGP